ncbi:MAG: hypothetical protein ACD_73C00289G0002 [uncultured bacterium]|nr:MAG: hypothetical protein ACD_73C00289G0002 [uncultured bacterium]
MNILVTGSAGFLGQNLIPILKNNGHHITGIDLNPDYLSDEFTQQDIRKGILLKNKSIDICIHLASYVGGFLNNQKKLGQEQYEIDLLMQTYKFLSKSGCQRIIYTSSINVFEQSQNYSHGPLAIANQHTHYARAKKMGEEFVQTHFDSFIILRPTNLFGKTQTTNKIGIVGSSHVIPELLKKIEECDVLTVLGDGSQVRNFVHVSDVSHFIQKILGTPERAWYNLRSEIHLTIKELAQQLIKLINIEKKIVFQPEYLSYEPVSIQLFDMSEPVSLGWVAKITSIQQGLNP